jgi:hypothetical protein
VTLRDELLQLRYVARGEIDAEARKRRHEVARHLSLPPTRPRRRRIGEVWGITMVRNEEDVIRTTIDHLFAQGVDRVLVSDNLSTDGTPQILRDLARNESRLVVATDTLEAYHQDHKMTLMARYASRAGADWLVPFDADELWFAESTSVADHLRDLGGATPRVGTVRASWHDCVPLAARGQDWRTDDFLVNGTPASLAKVAVRAHPLVRINFGNHSAARAGDRAGGLHIAHVAYRSPHQLAAKVRRGSSALALAERGSMYGWHWRNLARLSDRQIDALWVRAQSGTPLPDIPLNTGGPLVRCQPLEWRTWDPEGLLTSWSHGDVR